ncbi:MAG: elongation factor G, partial [Desulfobacteraceae bacterium]|nr:elongation factor G [Desulfobacteraceae bacterium]
DFTIEVERSLRVLDGVIAIFSAVEGVEPQSETVWRQADRFGVPRICFVNKMDRTGADFWRTIDSIVHRLGANPAAIHIPIGAESYFRGVVDLISQKAYVYASDGKRSASEIPAELQDQVASEREALVENIAETDDALLEKYLDGHSITEDELLQGLRAGALARTFVPVLCGSATKQIGIDLLLDCVNVCLPSPLEHKGITGTDPVTGETRKPKPDPAEPFSALVFKTIADPYAGRLSIFRIYSGTLNPDSSFYNPSKETKERFGQLLRIAGKEQKPMAAAGPGDIVAIAKLKETTTGDTLCDEANKILFQSLEPFPTLISYAIAPKSKGDEDKIFTSLSRLMEEDPTLKLDRDAETKQIIISGMGQIHIETMAEKLKRKFGVEVILNTPKIPYKETIKQAVKGVVYRHKKQSGGRGQFAEVHFDISPQEEGKGFEFEQALAGMNVPRNFVPAVEKGIVEAMPSGVLAGYPVVDVKVRFYDGKSHEVDSSEMAYKIAASMCFKKGLQEAKPTMLEPIMNLTVSVSEDYMGDVIGDLNSRRGKVLGMEAKGKKQLIQAQVPMAEILRYAPDLTSMTGGRGSFTSEFDHYEEVPANIVQKIIEQEKKE